MTDHAVKISVSASQESDPSAEPSPGPPDWAASLLKDRVNKNVLNNFTEKQKGKKLEPTQKNTQLDGNGTNYISMIYRVDNDLTKQEVLDKFENKVIADSVWFRIEYHECTENDGGSEGCPAWTVEREKGNVPEGVR